MVSILDVIIAILENFCLGNYPELRTEYVSHEGIYDYIEELVPKGKEKPAPAASVRADSEKTALINDVLKRIRRNLEIHHDVEEVACFLRRFLAESVPRSEKESGNLVSILSDLTIPSIQGAGETSEWEVLCGDLLQALQKAENGARAVAVVKNLCRILDFLIPHPEKVTCQQASSSQETTLARLVAPLSKSPLRQPANALRLPGKMKDLFSKEADAIPQLLTAFQPRLRDVLYDAWSKADVTAPPVLKSVHALRLTASPFGCNAPVRMKLMPNTDTRDRGLISVPDGDWPKDEDEEVKRIYLDSAHDDVSPGAHLVIRNLAKGLWPTSHYLPDLGNTIAARVAHVITTPRTAYSLTGKTTQITLSRKWLDDAWFSKSPSGTAVGTAGTAGGAAGGAAGGTAGTTDQEVNPVMASIRNTTVYVETEEFLLAEEPHRDVVAGNKLDLRDLYDGLEPGRWVLVSGERSDLSGTTGVQGSELAMISLVEQVADRKLPGDKTHTRITFFQPLAYSYRRETVTVNANVVKATHGETKKEVLGSGDGSKALQSFTLKQPPLTYLPAANSTGAESTLSVYVNDVRWHEADSLVGLSPTDRAFITRTDDAGNTTVIFGNGRQGARPSTGAENIRAQYRSGIGKPGNVVAGRVSLLASRPLGVRGVVNPQRSSGGADRETRDQARRNAPLPVKALDRLVSVRDYEDFSRSFAGIGKSSATRLSDGRRRVVHVTIAGVDDLPIDESSELFNNLHQALLDLGDPQQPVLLAVRELKLMVMSAGVSILPDYQWEPVVTQVRASLLDAFGFEKRELGQSVVLSELIAVMQQVPGVSYVDVDAFGAIPEKRATKAGRRLLAPEEMAHEVARIIKAAKKSGVPSPLVSANLAGLEKKNLRPAQLAFLSPDVPATLVLNQIS